MHLGTAFTFIMPLYRLTGDLDGRIKVAVWKTTESESELQKMIPSVFMAEYAKQLSAFKAPKRRLEWLATRVVVHHVLGIDHPISYYSTGRPHRPEDDISIAHTANFAAVALSACGRVGIDIEQYGPKVMRVLPYFVQQGERPAEPMDRNYALFLWTVKEAVYKLYDAGLSMLNDILVPPVTLQHEGNAEAHIARLGRKCHVHYVLGQDFVTSLVYE